MVRRLEWRIIQQLLVPSLDRPDISDFCLNFSIYFLAEFVLYPDNAGNDEFDTETAENKVCNCMSFHYVWLQGTL